MNRVLEKVKQNQFFLTVLAITCLFTIYPLINGYFLVGHDYEYHLWRIENIKDAILSGQYLVKIGPSFINGHGYATSLFYPDILLYIPAILRIFGLSIELSYKLFIALCILLTFISTYISSKLITKSKMAAMAITILFTLSQYYLYNIYTRAALGEVQAYIFIPFVILGIHSLIFENFEHNWAMCLGFSGLMLTHTNSLVMMLVITFILSLINIKKIIFDKSKVIKIIKTAILTLILTSFFWIPLLEIMASDTFKYQFPWARVSQKATSIGTIMNSYGIGIGINIIILSLVGLFIDRKKILKSRYYLLVGIIILITTTGIFPWEIFDETIFNTIQFPWRLLTYATIFLCISIGLYIVELERNNYSYFKAKHYVLLILFISCGYASLFYSTEGVGKNRINIVDNEFKQTATPGHIGGGMEWLPSSIENIDTLMKSNNLVSNSGDYIDYDKKGVNIRFDYNKDNNYKYFDIPLIYYKGYKAEMILEDGTTEQLKLEKSEDNSLIRVYPIANKNGVINIDYGGTFTQKITLIISVISILYVFYNLILNTRKRRLKYK